MGNRRQLETKIADIEAKIDWNRQMIADYEFEIQQLEDEINGLEIELTELDDADD